MYGVRSFATTLWYCSTYAQKEIARWKGESPLIVKFHLQDRAPCDKPRNVHRESSFQMSDIVIPLRAGYVGWNPLQTQKAKLPILKLVRNSCLQNVSHKRCLWASMFGNLMKFCPFSTTRKHPPNIAIANRQAGIRNCWSCACWALSWSCFSNQLIQFLTSYVRH